VNEGLYTLSKQRSSPTPISAGAEPQGAAAVPVDPRVALQERVNECWARLEDAVSELSALHEVNEDAIVDRTRGTIAAEHAPSDQR
jgi:hypothetical protein